MTTHKAEELTRWFNGSIKPVRKGLYEIRYFTYGKEVRDIYTFTEWKWWRREYVLFPLENQRLEWRGLNKNPKV